MNDNRLEIDDLRVSYDGTEILKGVSLKIPDRSVTAIIGPSGCGKTTLLRSINRMIDLSDGVKVSGDVRVDGTSVYERGVDVTAIRKRIGLISQKPSPLPMSIYDNVVYGPRIHGERDRTRLDEIAEQALAAAGLWEEVKNRLKDPAAKLSVGQQQRMCLARSLAVGPEIILCDEPTSALDPISSQNIEKKLQELKKDYTIIIVTHILRQARRLADYVAFLYLGELVEFGPASEVLVNPKEPRTQAYIRGEIS